MQREMTEDRIKNIHANVKRIALERAIVRALIRHMKERGWSVLRTYDGVDFEWPATEAAALDLVFDLDEVSLRFVPTASWTDSPKMALRKAAAASEHGVLLVLGNGCDVIADWNYRDGDPDGFNAAMDAFDVERVAQPSVPKVELDAAVERVASRGF